jgi:hypothetical protein
MFAAFTRIDCELSIRGTTHRAAYRKLFKIFLASNAVDYIALWINSVAGILVA